MNTKHESVQHMHPFDVFTLVNNYRPSEEGEKWCEYTNEHIPVTRTVGDETWTYWLRVQRICGLLIAEDTNVPVRTAAGKVMLEEMQVKHLPRT